MGRPAIVSFTEGYPNMNVTKGDYVLATKYCDGDPGDQWVVGFYDGQRGDRYYVVNGEGQQFRANGFRRAKTISERRGAWLLQHRPDIESGDRSLWWWARTTMG